MFAETFFTWEQPDQLQINFNRSTHQSASFSAGGLTLVKEDTIPLGDAADQFAVGLFSKDKPAVIVVPGAVFYRDGDKYAKKAASGIKQINGSVRFADGTENFMVITQREGPPESYSIDLSADNPVKAGKEIPQPDQQPGLFRDISLLLPAGMLESAPFPDEIKKGGIVRLFVPEQSKQIYVLVAWQSAAAHIAILGASDFFGAPSGGLKPLWTSPALTGKILDIAIGPSVTDPRTSGIYVLQQAGIDGKARQLEFFTVESPAHAGD